MFTAFVHMTYVH